MTTPCLTISTFPWRFLCWLTGSNHLLETVQYNEGLGSKPFNNNRWATVHKAQYGKWWLIIILCLICVKHITKCFVCVCLVAQVSLILCNPRTVVSPVSLSICPCGYPSPGRVLEWAAYASSQGDLPNSGDRTQVSPHCRRSLGIRLNHQWKPTVPPVVSPKCFT